MAWGQGGAHRSIGLGQGGTGSCGQGSLLWNWRGGWRSGFQVGWFAFEKCAGQRVVSRSRNLLTLGGAVSLRSPRP